MTKIGIFDHLLHFDTCTSRVDEQNLLAEKHIFFFEKIKINLHILPVFQGRFAYSYEDTGVSAV